MSLVLTVTGTILLIQAIKIVIPLGNTEKYVAFVLGLFFMAALLDAAGQISFTGEELFPPDPPITETAELEQVQNNQILKEYEKQLTDDLHRTLPQLSDAEFSFSFSENPFGQVEQLTIVSSRPISESVLSKLSELYGISREVIKWETK